MVDRHQRKRVRGVGALCCHCTRNVAYYRAGWVDNVLVSNDAFWITANGNFLDISILEWWKLFGERNGKHHWRKVVPEPGAFLCDLFGGIGVTENKFSAHCGVVQTYRDKFVAHLDDAGRTMHIPTLTIVVDSAVFLYDRVRNAHQELLPDSDFPRDLQGYYRECLKHGRRHYPNAT